MQWKILAGLRFFLAWIVVCEHIKLFTPEADKNFLFVFSKLNAVAAVFGFLLISGYSIANSITKKPEGFYKRRVLRIYPLYFLAVLLSLIPFLVSGSTIKIPREEIYQPDLWTVVGNFMFLQGWFVSPLQSDAPLWTLSVEIFCYLLAPFFRKLSNKILAIIIGLSSTLYVLFPYLYKIVFPGSKVIHYAGLKYGLSFCLLLWVWLLGFLYFRKNKNKLWRILLIGFGGLMLLLNQNHIGKIGILTYLVSALVVAYSSSTKLPSFLLKIFDYLGNISYPLYLIHVPTFIIAYSALGVREPTTLVFLSLLIAMLVYQIIDVPIHQKS